METKVIAMDIYGTALSQSSLFADRHPARDFVLEYIQRARLSGVENIVTFSDGSTADVKGDLRRKNFPESTFDGHFWVPIKPKDPSCILDYYSLSPQELLVIGDRETDVELAREIGCKTRLVPTYVGKQDAVFRDLEIN